jgi:hypothetical protein
MPATFLGVTPGTTYPNRNVARNRLLADPPNRYIVDQETGSGPLCGPYELWSAGDLIGGEETGMVPMKMTILDDIRFEGNIAGSKTIALQAVDSGGSPAPGVTAELWWTNVDWADAHQPLLIGTTVADANGYFGFAVPDSVKQYEVKVYDGSKGGITVRNLHGV